MRVSVKGCAVDDGGWVVECECTAAAQGRSGGVVMRVGVRSVDGVGCVGYVVVMREKTVGEREGVLHGVEYFVGGDVDAHLAKLLVPASVLGGCGNRAKEHRRTRSITERSGQGTA